MKKTAGTWNPDEPFISFLAAPLSFIETAAPHHPSCLIAVNELLRDDWRTHLDRLLDEGHQVLIDSGAFAIAAAHSRKHEIALEDAFKMPLDQLDGFPELYGRFLSVATLYQDDVWGIVEVDLGGEKQKKITRKKLEDIGLKPIPVFHPIGDSSAYLDELLDDYDRLCVGNLVSASRYARKRILQTLNDRRQSKDRRPWIHLLGMTPSEVLCAYPFESCDSSAWLNTVRWSGYVEKTCLKSIGFLPKNYQYQLGDRASWTMGVKMGAVGAHFQQANLRQYREAIASQRR